MVTRWMNCDSCADQYPCESRGRQQLFAWKLVFHAATLPNRGRRGRPDRLGPPLIGQSLGAARASKGLFLLLSAHRLQAMCSNSADEWLAIDNILKSNLVVPLSQQVRLCVETCLMSCQIIQSFLSIMRQPTTAGQCISLWPRDILGREIFSPLDACAKSSYQLAPVVRGRRE